MSDDPLFDFEVGGTSDTVLGVQGNGQDGPASSSSIAVRTWENVEDPLGATIALVGHARDTGTQIRDANCSPDGGVYVDGAKEIDGYVVEVSISTDLATRTVQARMHASYLRWPPTATSAEDFWGWDKCPPEIIAATGVVAPTTKVPETEPGG